MKAIVLCALVILSCRTVQSQNTDLPAPTANNQTLPSGSYVIAMDNTNQVNNSGVFNYKAYGLIVTLLNNNKKVKWVIKAGKTKDGIDFTVNATKIKPTAGSAASFNFKAGPFVIFASDTTGVAAIVDTYNSAISNANDKIKMYKTNASVTVDVRYDLTGFVPKALVLTDGTNAVIHTTFMSVCNIPSGNYQTGPASDLLIKCYTFASEPHNTKTGSAQNDAVAAVKRFTQYGGNFLAQCEGVQTYENNSLGHFQTSTGITDANSTAGTAISYPNPDLSFSQFEGNFDISITGSLQNWRINAAWANSGHKHSRATGDTTVIGTSVSKIRSGTGGMIFYIGNHDFNSYTTITEVNGIRMYMNAFLTPAALGNNCTIGSAYAYPLAVKLTNFEGVLNKGKVTLNWKVATNETVTKFAVEKSADGIHYSDAFSLNATERNGEEQYSWAEPMKTDKVFYRLRITEKSGYITYSKILIFQSAASATDRIRIINNPVTDDKLTFEYLSSASQPLEARVIDITGRLQFKQALNSREGTNLSSILLPSALQPGMYILDLASGSSHTTVKFIKQ